MSDVIPQDYPLPVGRMYPLGTLVAVESGMDVKVRGCGRQDGVSDGLHPPFPAGEAHRPMGFAADEGQIAVDAAVALNGQVQLKEMLVRSARPLMPSL